MKTRVKTSSAILLLLVLLINVTTSCEKHDGIEYFKSKCEAELNGQLLIDQSRFNLIGPTPTPYLQISEYEVTFESHLSTRRGEMPLYYVDIQIFADKEWGFLTEPQIIRFVKKEQTDENFSWEWEYISDYRNYCYDNKINFATIFRSSDMKTEIVKEGSFHITEYDLKKNKYKGKFTLLFSEGTLNGEFSI